MPPNPRALTNRDYRKGGTKNKYMNWIFEQYEFKGWLITISNYMGMEDSLHGFACPVKYAHLLTIDNYEDYFDEIAEENNIPFEIDEEDGDRYYTDDDYTYVDAIEEEVGKYGLGIDFSKSSCVLEYMVKAVLIYINQDKLIDKIYRGNNYQTYNDTKLVILKQINKKSSVKKQNQTKPRGNLHFSWASLVKNRDKECKKCKSKYDLHAHHIQAYKNHPDLRYDLSNGITLCGKCHRLEHKSKTPPGEHCKEA
jgi:5-methylcytosine-specific restriction endonuclease McrA